MSAATQPIDPQSRLGRLIVRQAQKAHLAAVWAQEAGIAPGMTVLDIGAGSGALSFEYAAIVGPAGQVIALDPDADCTEYINAEAARRDLTLRALTGSAETLPALPTPNTLPALPTPDRIMLTDALHHMQDPLAALRALRAVIPAWGVLFVAEYDPAGPGHVGAKLARRTDPDALTALLGQARFKIHNRAAAQDEHYTILAVP